METKTLLPVHIAAEDGVQSIDIAIAGYQYEAETESEDDANWLNVAVTYRDGAVEHSCVDACLQTSELDSLAESFEEWLAEEGLDTGIVEFMEPNLRFSIRQVGPEYEVRFIFDHGGKLGGDVPTVDFACKVTLDELTSAGDKLNTFAEAFPYRHMPQRLCLYSEELGYLSDWGEDRESPTFSKNPEDAYMYVDSPEDEFYALDECEYDKMWLKDNKGIDVEYGYIDNDDEL